MMLPLFVLTVFVAVLVDGNAVRNMATSQYQGNAEWSDDQDYSARIFGGEEAKLGQFKSTVFIYSSDGKMCTGTIISPHWVLTAAHCLPRSYMSVKFHPWSSVNWGRPTMTIAYGCVDFKGIKCTKRFVEDYFEHDKAVTSTLNSKGRNMDVALLKIKHKIQFSDTVGSSPLMIEPMPYNLSNCIVQGFGRKDFEVSDIPDIDGKLHYLNNINAGNEQFCNDIAQTGLIVYEEKPSNLCAYNYKNPAAEVCGGDSGSALLCPAKSGGFTVVGVMTTVYNQCGHNYNPTLMLSESTRAAANWIKETTNGDPDIQFDALLQQ